MQNNKPLTPDEFIRLYSRAGKGTKELITEILTTCDKLAQAGRTEDIADTIKRGREICRV